MRKTRNKEAHNVLLRQYIKEIENPDRHGFIGGKWVQSPYKGDDPNNRGYGIDVLQNKAAAKLTQGRQGKWLTEDEERMLRNKHIKDVNDAVNNHYYKYLRRTPLSEEKEIMATGLLYRGDHINGTKLAEPYYNGSNADFQKAVENYYRSKNLNDRAWRSKEFMDAHKSQSPFSTISLESPYVPMEYVGYHSNEDYYYAGELPQVDADGEHGYADGGMLYGNQDVMPSTPQEDYQQGEQADYQVEPRQWDDLSLSEKNAFIANAVQHGITNMEDIRNAYNELMQEQLNGNDSMDDMEDSHKFLKGGYKPSRYIKNFISHMEGASMKTNRSFDAEAKDFWNALPNNVKGKITQEQADALYSYSYNVGAGNFKNRVVPALERYFSGNGSVEDVQRHMYATKDNQLRGLAKRRAQERAMFAGSEVPVYYNEDYTPQSTNSQWRNSRLGPVTAKSFNISQGLGPVSNTSNTLGPVTSSDYMAQRNKENTEALANILYGSQPMTAFDAPQETTQETSGIDRYNEIQDLLSTPYTFANGGEKDSGVTSTNGLYHASPSEYAGILDSVVNNNPLEVTLPDTTVTASDPSNYRSYYDPNGAAEFMGATTLGLFPHPFNLSRDASTFIQHPSWGNVWNTTKDALMFAGGAGYNKAFAPLGIMNLMDKDGVRKTYGLAKGDNYVGAVMSGLGDALNAGMVVKPIYTVGKNYVNNVEKRVAETFMRTTPAYNPLYEAENGFINIWNGLNGGKPRLAHIANYWFTGHKTGPKGYYNSFAGFNPYNESQLVSNPTLKERIQGLIHPEGTSFAYSGFSSSAGKVPAIKDGNDLIDAYLYGRDIDPIYGVKKIAQGKGFGVHSDFIKKNYANKANNIPVYEMNTSSRYSDSDIKSSNIWHSAEEGLFDTGSFNTSVNAAGHLYKEGITSYGKPVVMQQDIWKFKPDDYYTKWFENYNLTPLMKNVIKFGLKEVDRLGTPVITRTKWIDKKKAKMKTIE